MNKSNQYTILNNYRKKEKKKKRDIDLKNNTSPQRPQDCPTTSQFGSFLLTRKSKVSFVLLTLILNSRSLLQQYYLKENTT